MADEDSGVIVKQEEDYTEEVDQALPLASSLAEVKSLEYKEREAERGRVCIRMYSYVFVGVCF
jgi:hypothetical protein